MTQDMGNKIMTRNMANLTRGQAPCEIRKSTQKDCIATPHSQRENATLRSLVEERFLLCNSRLRLLLMMVLGVSVIIHGIFGSFREML